LWASIAATVAGVSALELYRIGLAIRQYSPLAGVIEALTQPLSTSSVSTSNSLVRLLDTAFNLLLCGDFLFRFASV
jgi:hypothetical protein